MSIASFTHEWCHTAVRVLLCLLHDILCMHKGSEQRSNTASCVFLMLAHKPLESTCHSRGSMPCSVLKTNLGHRAISESCIYSAVVNGLHLIWIPWWNYGSTIISRKIHTDNDCRVSMGTFMFHGVILETFYHAFCIYS